MNEFLCLLNLVASLTEGEAFWEDSCADCRQCRVEHLVESAGGNEESERRLSLQYLARLFDADRAFVAATRFLLFIGPSAPDAVSFFRAMTNS